MSNKSNFDNFQASALPKKAQAQVKGGNTLTILALEAELKVLQKDFQSISGNNKKLIKADYLATKDAIKCEIELNSTGGNGDGVW